MKNVYYVFVLFFNVLICNAQIWDGNTIEYPYSNDAGIYIIDSPEKLAGISKLVKNDQEWSKGKIFKQTCDIDLGNKNWMPIGDVYPFKGEYDGGGFKIKNIKISEDSYDDVYAGLFGGNSGKIKNVIVESFSFEGKDPRFIGAIVGNNTGEISNCISNANLNLYNNNTTVYGGGIVGQNRGIIKECRNFGSISVKVGDSYHKYSYAGGIAGENTKEIVACENVGKVYAYTGDSPNTNRARSYAGGICAENDIDGEIYGCKNTGEISAETGKEDFMDSYSGGIIGKNNGKLYASYSLGYIIGNIKGGVVGENSNVISGCFYNISSSGCNDSDKGFGVSISQIKNEISEEMNTILELNDFEYIWKTDEDNQYPYIVFKDKESGIINNTISDIRYSIANNRLKIFNAPKGKDLFLFSLNGTLLNHIHIVNNTIDIPVTFKDQICILKISGKKGKIIYIK